MNSELGQNYRISRNIILDLGNNGREFRNVLEQEFHELAQDFNTQSWAVETVYSNIMADVVRLIELDPLDAVEQIKSLPSPSSLNDVVLHVNHECYGRIAEICQHYIMRVYLCIRNQFYPPDDTAYIPVKAGADYLAITECVRI